MRTISKLLVSLILLTLNLSHPVIGQETNNPSDKSKVKGSLEQLVDFETAIKSYNIAKICTVQEVQDSIKKYGDFILHKDLILLTYSSSKKEEYWPRFFIDDVNKKKKATPENNILIELIFDKNDDNKWTAVCDVTENKKVLFKDYSLPGKEILLSKNDYSNNTSKDKESFFNYIRSLCYEINKASTGAYSSPNTIDEYAAYFYTILQNNPYEYIYTDFNTVNGSLSPNGCEIKKFADQKNNQGAKNIFYIKDYEKNNKESYETLNRKLSISSLYGKSVYFFIMKKPSGSGNIETIKNSFIDALSKKLQNSAQYIHKNFKTNSQIHLIFYDFETEPASTNYSNDIKIERIVYNGTQIKATSQPSFEPFIASSGNKTVYLDYFNQSFNSFIGQNLSIDDYAIAINNLIDFNRTAGENKIYILYHNWINEFELFLNYNEHLIEGCLSNSYSTYIICENFNCKAPLESLEEIYKKAQPGANAFILRSKYQSINQVEPTIDYYFHPNPEGSTVWSKNSEWIKEYISKIDSKTIKDINNSEDYMNYPVMLFSLLINNIENPYSEENALHCSDSYEIGSDKWNTWVAKYALFIQKAYKNQNYVYFDNKDLLRSFIPSIVEKVYNDKFSVFETEENKKFIIAGMNIGFALKPKDANKFAKDIINHPNFPIQIGATKGIVLVIEPYYNSTCYNPQDGYITIIPGNQLRFNICTGYAYSGNIKGIELISADNPSYQVNNTGQIKDNAAIEPKLLTDPNRYKFTMKYPLDIYTKIYKKNITYYYFLSPTGSLVSEKKENSSIKGRPAIYEFSLLVHKDISSGKYEKYYRRYLEKLFNNSKIKTYGYGGIQYELKWGEGSLGDILFNSSSEINISYYKNYTNPNFFNEHIDAYAEMLYLMTSDGVFNTSTNSLTELNNYRKLETIKPDGYFIKFEIIESELRNESNIKQYIYHTLDLSCSDYNSIPLQIAKFNFSYAAFSNKVPLSYTGYYFSEVNFYNIFYLACDIASIAIPDGFDVIVSVMKLYVQLNDPNYDETQRLDAVVDFGTGIMVGATVNIVADISKPLIKHIKLKKFTDLAEGAFSKTSEKALLKKLLNPDYEDLILKLGNKNITKQFITDFADISGDIFEKIIKNPELIDSWKLIRNCGDNELAKLATNIDELKLVSKNFDNIADAGSYKAWKLAEAADDAVGKYSTKIKWGTREIDARPFGDKGYWGKRIKQSEPRADAYELKINPNNESFYVWNPEKSRYVQFENIASDALQDGKCVLKPDNSIYRVYDKEEFLRQNILEEALDQVGAAKAKGLKVEWLVSDKVAVDQLSRFFKEKNIDINVKYLAE